jgi:predicted mannosyl-3-phosphoglycerate phosphatase (HAD superfamily)
MHVSGYCNKGRALRWLTRQYESDDPGRSIITVAVGDSHNDAAMLETADMAVIVRSPVNAMPDIDRHQYCYRSTAYGPEGWVEGMNDVLDLLRNSGRTTI